MLQFLPQNLNLDEILRKNPPPFKYHKDNFIHILSLLMELPAKKKDLLTDNGYIPLNAGLLKKIVHNYTLYVKYLIDMKVIECDGYYVPGEKSRAYRFMEQYCTQVVPVEIEKYTLLKAINSQSNYDRNMKAKYGYLYKWLGGLQIDYKAAKELLNVQFKQDKEVNYFKAVRRYNANMATVMCIKEGMVRFRVDETSGRLHTYLTCLNKDLRNYVSYEGQPLAAVDIVCSQPTLSLALLKTDFYQEIQDGVGTANIYRVAPDLIKEIPIGEIAKLVYNNSEKFTSYIEAVERDLYEYMKPHLEKATGREWKNRKEIKRAMFSVLYSDNRFIGQKEAEPKRIFKALFPEVYELFALYKKKGAANLPVLLQKLEVKLVLDGAAKKLGKAIGGIPIFTIHDSIVIPKGDEEVITQHLKGEARNMLGIGIKTKAENWLKEPALL